MRVYRSILNDVLGPIMTGPSSSHCAGCCRIGLVTRQLFGKEIEHAEVVFDEDGSYPSTYIGQGSNYGFTGGLLGYETDDPRLKDAVEIAKEQNRQIVFRQEALGALHPNQAEIRIYDGDSVAMRVMTFSIGGGMFQIKGLDEFKVHIEGTDYQVFVCCRIPCAETLRRDLENSGFVVESENCPQTGRSLLCVRSHEDILSSVEHAVGDTEGVIYIRPVRPVVPNVRKQENPPFFNAEEALAYANGIGRELWQLLEDYEAGYGNISQGEISERIRSIRIAMEKSITPVDPTTTRKYGFLPYQAAGMRDALPAAETVNTGLIEAAMFAALSVLENSNAHNIVVAAPTAGSSGVLPAAIISVGRQLRKTDIEIERAIMSAGVVGVFIANQATFGGEVGACQAEIGSACSMAAAGIVQLLGGSIHQSFSGASLALQNMLGLICDPIAGLTEIPCIGRNVMAAANAVMSANMILLGFNPVIPLDEVIHTMNEVGHQLPSELKCTCKGGLCTTMTGRQMAKRMEKRCSGQ